MIIPDNYEVSLEFEIDDLENAKNTIKQRWMELKTKCEITCNRAVVEKWLDECCLSSNQDLPYLDREEGGFGGNNNLLHKQVRFRRDWCIPIKDNKIKMNVYHSQNEKWSLDELNDLKNAFIRYADDYVCCECVDGCITIKSDAYTPLNI